MLAACGGKTGTADDKSPEATVTKFFDALIAGNYDEAARYTHPERAGLSIDNSSLIIYDAYFPTLSYSNLQLAPVEETVQNWGYLAVFIEVNAKDMDMVLQSVLMSYLMNNSSWENASKEAISAFITKQLTNAIQAAPAESTTLTVKLLPAYNDSWAIIDIDELLDELALSPFLRMLEEFE
jgi:hypothetical protein